MRLWLSPTSLPARRIQFMDGIGDHAPNLDLIKCRYNLDKSGMISLQGDLVILDDDTPHKKFLLEDHHYCSPVQRHNGPINNQHITCMDRRLHRHACHSHKERGGRMDNEGIQLQMWLEIVVGWTREGHTHLF